MEKYVKTVRTSLWIVLGIAIILSNLALNRPSQLVQDSTATPLIQTGTIVNEEAQDGGAGSTDWIMLLAVVIVLIVIIPILLKRRAWETEKENSMTPPD